MMRAAVFFLGILLAPASFASEVYKAKCALCHDGGATGAPRAGRPADWTKRAEKGYAGLLGSALKGVPSTAMLPKAGFPELTDAEVAEAVRYLLATVKLDETLAAAPANSPPPPRAPLRPVDDVTLAVAVADALVKVKIGGVKIEARDGRITRMGMVDDAKAAQRALEAAQAVPGVREIENRLVSAEIFEHD